MSKLKAKDPELATTSRPKILIFGKAGVGKTWASLDFPGVYYIDTEGGAKEDHYKKKLKAAGGKYLGPEDGALDFKTVVEQIEGLATEVHPYKTVIIDSFTKLFTTAIANEADRLDREGIKNEFARDKKPATGFTRKLIMWADRMDLNLILICHQEAEWGSDAKGNRIEIGQTFAGAKGMDYELGLCLNITKAGDSRYATVKKSRLENFKDNERFEWSYNAFATKFGRDRIEAAVKPVELATPEQVADLARLLENVKLPEGELDKWLSKAKATSIAEFSGEQAAKIIESLKKKIS